MGISERAQVRSSNLRQLRVHIEGLSDTQGHRRARPLGAVRGPSMTRFEKRLSRLSKSAQEVSARNAQFQKSHLTSATENQPRRARKKIFLEFFLTSRPEHNQKPPTDTANRHCAFIPTRRKIAVWPQGAQSTAPLARGRSKITWTVAERQADRRGFNERDQEGAFDQTRRDTTTHSPVK